MTTKICVLVDANGLPLALKLTEGQAQDACSAHDILATLAEGKVLLADWAYDSDALRGYIKARGAWANIQAMPRRTETAFSPSLFRYRNHMKRFFGELKHFPAISACCDKRADAFMAAIKLASLKIWMRFTRL